MPATHTLLLFTLAVLGLMVSPGPNMAFVLSQSVAHGPRGGVAVAGGILAADLVMTALTVLGVVALVAAWRPSFDVLRMAGAAYLGWLAICVWRPVASPMISTPDAPRLGRVFGRAVLISLLNPKALVFFLVFLPQFVEPTLGPIATQLLWLGGVMSVVAFAFHALLGMFGGALGRWVGRCGVPPWGLMALQSGIFLLLALRLLLLAAPASV